MEEFIGSAAAAALVSGIISIVMWLLQRHAAKDDRKDQTLETVQRIEEKLNAHISESEEQKASNARYRVLRFADEVITGASHTKEHWSEILDAIDYYEDYCAAHPAYSNNKAVLAISMLKDTYTELLRDNKFL